MSKKIFNSIWVVALAVFLASLLFIMGMSYSYFSDVQEVREYIPGDKLMSIHWKLSAKTPRHRRKKPLGIT